MTEQVFAQILAPRERPRITCSSSGRAMEPLECYCCSGYQCWHHDGAYLRLLNDVKARPWRYEDAPWVYRLSDQLQRIRRNLR
jgi:hypothetical protein